MTDLEKLKVLFKAAADEPYESNTIHHSFMVEAATALPALIAELEAAREVVEAVKVTHAISNRPGHEAWQRVEATLAHYQEVTK